VTVNDEFEGTVVAYVKLLSQDLPRGTEESCEQHEIGQPLSRPRFEPEPSRIRSRDARKDVVVACF